MKSSNNYGRTEIILGLALAFGGMTLVFFQDRLIENVSTQDLLSEKNSKPRFREPPAIWRGETHGRQPARSVDESSKPAGETSEHQAPNSATLGLSVIEQKIAKGRLLAEHTTLQDDQGSFRRIRVFETDDKYPLLRVVESFKAGARGVERENLMAMVSDHVLVKLNPSRSEGELEAYATELGAHIRRVSNSGLYLVAFHGEDPLALEKKLEQFQANANLVSATEPDLIYTAPF